MPFATVAQTPPRVESYADMHLGDARSVQPSEWKALLDKAWQQDGQPIRFSVGAANQHLTVDRCTTSFTADARKLRPQPQDAAIYDAWAIKCQAARLLSEATAPSRDYLHTFALDDAGVRALPAHLAFAISSDDARRVKAIVDRKGTLKDYLSHATIEVSGTAPHRRVVIHDAAGGVQRLAMLAKGDFDHDGIADVLVVASNQVAGGDYRTTRLYVVSRLSRDGRLEIRKKISATSTAD